MRVLVTGFEPFGGDKENPTSMLAEDLEGEYGEYEVMGEVLPVSVNKVRGALEKAILENEPDVCVHFGLAPGYSNLAIERIAINVLDARIPDNDGYQPKDVKIVEGGPLAYFSTLPTRKIYERCVSEGVPARLSYSAGTYLCNMVMYLSLHINKEKGIAKASGFVHVPYLPRQVVEKNYLIGKATPSMCYEIIRRGAKIAIEESVRKVKERIPEDLSFS